MTITAPKLNRKQYKIEDLMDEMPNGLPRVEGWEEMQSVGIEAV